MSYTPPPDHLTEMLRAQRAFQHRLGHDFMLMIDRERIAFIKDMYIAAVQELGEALNETSWKPWAEGERISTDAFLGELNDVTQFIFNMWFTVLPFATPEDLAVRMHRNLDKKLEINHQRVTDGYDGISGKCPNCRRALEEVAVKEVHAGNGELMYYCVCGVVLPLDVVSPYLVD